VLSLEPLLSLISHLAHDLGTRFEAHFARIVTLVASLGAKHPAVEVTEWSFTCLAWLFKYLSRLLVPDLRPVYQIMAPLLGKEMQKRYVTRFAAEAMSFLIRKAAIASQRGQDFLRILIDYIVDDLLSFSQHKGSSLYRYGVMTLFADAIKGINRGVHTCGVTIYKSLCATMETPKAPSSVVLELIRGVTVNVVHHTSEASFSSIIDVLVANIKILVTSHPPSIDIVLAYGDLLYTAAAVRKGSRIQDWQPVLECSILLLEHSGDEDVVDPLWTVDAIDKLVALALHHSPFDTVIPKVRGVMDTMLNTRKYHFLQFCTFFCTLDRERYQSFIPPFFVK
jgi:U3 small nucleolar RNA-associated protein 20